MTSDADRVAAKIEELFPSDAARVGRLLESLELPSTMGLDRVRLAILKVSGGDPERLRDAVDLARLDPRDVVGEAEYPRQMRLPPGMATEAMILADRRDYEGWLYGTVDP